MTLHNQLGDGGVAGTWLRGIALPILVLLLLLLPPLVVVLALLKKNKFDFLDL